MQKENRNAVLPSNVARGLFIYDQSGAGALPLLRPAGMTAKFDNTDGRMRGRKLQARRLRVWTADPRCAMCHRVVEFSARPGFGFELDHIKALKADGGKGEDTDENTQVLCCGPQGCHQMKTDRDMGHKQQVVIGLDGWPI